jgi:hypothetical protein
MQRLPRDRELAGDAHEVAIVLSLLRRSLCHAFMMRKMARGAKFGGINALAFAAPANAREPR